MHFFDRVFAESLLRLEANFAHGLLVNPLEQVNCSLSALHLDTGALFFFVVNARLFTFVVTFVDGAAEVDVDRATVLCAWMMRPCVSLNVSIGLWLGLLSLLLLQLLFLLLCLLRSLLSLLSSILLLFKENFSLGKLLLLSFIFGILL